MLSEWKNVGEFSKFLTGKPTRKKPLGRPRHRLEEKLEWISKKKMSIRRIRLIQLTMGIIRES